MSASRVERRSGAIGPAAGMLALAAGMWTLPCARMHAQSLPDAPSSLLSAARAQIASSREDAATLQWPATPTSSSNSIGEHELEGLDPVAPTLPPPPPCVKLAPTLPRILRKPLAPQSLPACEENPIQLIVTSPRVAPLSSAQKGDLAIRDILDPFNLIVVVGTSAVAVGANSHSAFGPGMRGFSRLTGYSLVEEAQGEFFGTYLIPSLTHEDPRYHRMPGAPVSRRIVHALVHTFVTQHDDGSPMPNYAVLATYPISAELSNLYVPGIATDGPATVRRFMLGLATDPTGSLIAEFLPDIAKRVHVRVIFMQQIINQVANGAPAVM